VSNEDRFRLALANLSSSGVTILGHHPGYTNAAKDIGASHFDIGPLWNELDDAERWKLNEHFLTKVAERRDTVVVWTPPDERMPGRVLTRELDFLFGRGYHWQEGSRSVLMPP
jgi:hypothetical protein